MKMKPQEAFNLLSETVRVNHVGLTQSYLQNIFQPLIDGKITESKVSKLVKDLSEALEHIIICRPLLEEGKKNLDQLYGFQSKYKDDFPTIGQNLIELYTYSRNSNSESADKINDLSSHVSYIDYLEASKIFIAEHVKEFNKYYQQLMLPQGISKLSHPKVTLDEGKRRQLDKLIDAVGYDKIEIGGKFSLSIASKMEEKYLNKAREQRRGS